jgi:hypothetical protein
MRTLSIIVCTLPVFEGARPQREPRQHPRRRRLKPRGRPIGAPIDHLRGCARSRRLPSAGDEYLHWSTSEHVEHELVTCYGQLSFRHRAPVICFEFCELRLDLVCIIVR